MITILKVQIPNDTHMKDFALAFNKDGSFKKFINIKKNPSLIESLMGSNKQTSYCKCEVNGDTIEK